MITGKNTTALKNDLNGILRTSTKANNNPRITLVGTVPRTNSAEVIGKTNEPGCCKDIPLKETKKERKNYCTKDKY